MEHKKRSKFATFSIVASIIILAVFVGGTIIIGLAASLGIDSGNALGAQTASPCTTNQIAVTLNASNKISATNIDTNCNGKTLSFHLTRKNGTSESVAGGVISGAALVSAGAVTTPATITNITPFVNGWNINHSWSWTAPTGTVTVSYVWAQSAPVQYCVDVTVSTTSVTPIPWKVSFNPLDYPYNGDLSINNYNLPNGYVLAYTGGLMNVTSTSKPNVVSGTPITYKMCNYGTPPPPLPSPTSGITFTKTETTPSPSYYVCKTVNVTSSGAQFFVGWKVDVDVTNLKSNFIPGTGGSLKAPNTSQYTITNVGNIYTMRGTDWNTQGIRDTTPRSFNVCWG